MSGAQGDLTRNSKTVTHTSNRNFEQKLLSNRTIPVLPLPMNPSIDQGIAPIILSPQTLLTSARKEVIVDAALCSAWVHWTQWQVSSMGVDGSTPGYILNVVIIVELSFPVLIGIVVTSPPWVINVSQDFGNKWRSTSPGLVGQSQKFYAVVDRKLPNNLNSTSIFSKVIGNKLSDGSRGDLYTRFRMNFAADPVQTQIPQFIYLGFSIINALDEGSGLSTPATRILMPVYSAHWIAPNHFFW